MLNSLPQNKQKHVENMPFFVETLSFFAKNIFKAVYLKQLGILGCHHQHMSATLPRSLLKKLLWTLSMKAKSKECSSWKLKTLQGMVSLPRTFSFVFLACMTEKPLLYSIQLKASSVSVSVYLTGKPPLLHNSEMKNWPSIHLLSKFQTANLSSGCHRGSAQLCVLLKDLNILEDGCLWIPCIPGMGIPVAQWHFLLSTLGPAETLLSMASQGDQGEMLCATFCAHSNLSDAHLSQAPCLLPFCCCWGWGRSLHTASEIAPQLQKSDILNGTYEGGFNPDSSFAWFLASPFSAAFFMTGKCFWISARVSKARH